MTLVFQYLLAVCQSTKVIAKRNSVEKIKSTLTDFVVEPQEINSYFSSINSSPITEKQKAQKILLRPDVELNEFSDALPRLKEVLKEFSIDSIEQASIQIKYDVYIEKEKELVKKMSQLEELEIHQELMAVVLTIVKWKNRREIGK